AMGIVRYHGLSLYQRGLRHVAGTRSARAGRDLALALLERLPLGPGGRAVLFRAYRQDDVCIGKPGKRVPDCENSQSYEVRAGARRSSARPELCRLRPAHHRRLPARLDGDLLASIGAAARGIPKYRALD